MLALPEKIKEAHFFAGALRRLGRGGQHAPEGVGSGIGAGLVCFAACIVSHF